MPSTQQLIEDAVVQYILTAGVPFITALNMNLFVRDFPERVDTDPSPSCIVCVGDESPAEKDPKSNSTFFFEYRVLVLLVKKGTLTPASDPWRKEARFKIRNRLNRSFLLGADGVVRRCTYNPRPEFNPVGFGAGYKVTTQLFIYRTEEVRGDYVAD